MTRERLEEIGSGIAIAATVAVALYGANLWRVKVNNELAMTVAYNRQAAAQERIAAAVELGNWVARGDHKARPTPDFVYARPDTCGAER